MKKVITILVFFALFLLNSTDVFGQIDKESNLNMLAKYLPCDLIFLIAKEAITPFHYGDSYNEPTIAVVAYDSNYKINFSEIDIKKAKGFRDEQVLENEKSEVLKQNCNQ